jgi:hypothetical protein
VRTPFACVHGQRLEFDRRALRRQPVIRLRRSEIITILLVVVVLMLLGAMPTWPHSRGWGYYPSGGLGLVLLVLVILKLSGRL